MKTFSELSPKRLRTYPARSKPFTLWFNPAAEHPGSLASRTYCQTR